MSVFRGTGTQFQRGDGASPEVFTAVADIVSLDGVNIAKADIDVTALDSTSGKEFISAIHDPGGALLELNWNPQDTAHLALRTDAEGSAKVNYRIVWSDVSSSQVTFSGEVMEFGLNTVPTDAAKATVRVKASGALTWA